MASRKTKTEAEALEMYRVSLDNAGTQPQIATIMAEFGYDAQTIARGKTLLNETRQTYAANKTEDDETSAAHATFTALRNQLEDTYSLHRKKAKVIFRNDPLILDKLLVAGSLPKAYVKWLETIRKFYSVTIADTELQGRLARLTIEPADLNAAQTLINSLEAARADYLREKGESQDYTKLKDDAFAKLDDWMRDFYSVAKIALSDRPQLLESLGKHVGQ